MTTATKTTGTCPCCFGEFVVKKGVMVLHGYLRPGYGYIIGNCPATRRFQPYEVSAEGTVYMRGLAKKALKTEQGWLKQLQAGEVLEFSHRRMKLDVEQMPYHERRLLNDAQQHETIIVKKGDGMMVKYGTQTLYENLLQQAIHNSEQRIDQIKSDIKFLNGKIADWKPVDLYAKNAEVAAAIAEEAKTLCPGSGTGDHDRSRMRFAYYKGGKCNHCHRMIGASSTGKLRKHTPEEKK